MLKKVFEEKFKDSFIKGYELNQSYNILDLINLLQELNIKINNIYLNENADLGLKSFEGNYSLEKFFIKYNQINKNDIDSVILSLENNNKLYINNRNYISLSSDTDIELDELLEKSKKL